MWERLNYKFKKYPARMNVAWKMVELGLRVDKDNKIYCGNLKISDVALSNAANVDRRAVKSTVTTILEDEQLSSIFKNIIPAGTLLKNIAKNLGLGIIEIEVGNENTGILAEASKLISAKNISIRQAYASDIELGDNPILTIITEEPVEGNLINELLKIYGVMKVSIY
ncbi:MAG: amino acid-binding protein [Methanobacteriaceae archaeon]|jgi:predicted regulator of amino acid metabolism with ACT domain|nr:amino acid-binding protein [Candidatus Methanorudis spinitermitis]